MDKVLIGIQARTNSTRLPNKAMKKILGVTIIDHVVNAALKSSVYLNRYSDKSNISTQVWVLVPKGDPLKDYLSKNSHIKVHEGNPTDLIERFNDVVVKEDFDYIVRLTADCPLLPPFLITKCINAAIKNKKDFLETANPDYRCFFDGADVEIMSRKAFDWLNENSKEREHVCTDLRENTPDWVNMGHVFAHIDQSFIKLSVDTEDDYSLVNNQYKSVRNKKRKWEDKYGKGTAFMF